MVDTDTDGEILSEDWEVRELQPVPVTDDDTHLEADPVIKGD